MRSRGRWAGPFWRPIGGRFLTTEGTELHGKKKGIVRRVRAETALRASHVEIHGKSAARQREWPEPHGEGRAIVIS